MGALVRVTADTDADPATPPVTMTRLLAPIGGHAGKQMGFDVHVGLGKATQADRVEILWATAPPRAATTLEHVEAGRLTVRFPAE
ncbi:MAG: ASPIC/UnbV domain-containing protein [Phycisphaerales bacterium]